MPEHEALKQEWNAVFSKEVNLILIKSWMVILGIYKIYYLLFAHLIQKKIQNNRKLKTLKKKI